MFLVEADGSRLRRFTRAGRAAAWSPDGRSVAFVSPRGLFVKPVGGATRTLVRWFPPRRPLGPPSWAPDGQSIAYATRRSGTGVGGSVRVVSHDGRRSRTVIPDRTGCRHVPVAEVAWSPDGRHLAVTRGCRGALQGIWLHDLRGRTIRRLVRNARAPAWSPSGEQLAFARDCDVRLVDLATAAERRVVRTGCDIGGISWSPDGLWLAFDAHSGRCPTEAPYHAALFIVGSAGGTVRDLGLPCNGSGFLYPSWQPDRIG